MSMNNAPLLQKKSRVWLIVAIILLVGILAAAIPLLLLHASQQNASTLNGGVEPQSFSVGSNAVLVIKEQGGDISVHPSNTNVITVTPRAHGTLTAPNPQNVKILYTHTSDAQGHDQITVSTDPWFSNTDFSVTIPSTTSTQITLDAGSIDVHAGHGLTASTSSGSIALDNLQGPVDARTSSGDITASALSGPLTLITSSGSIRLRQITGQLDARTSSGDVLVSESVLSGNSLLQTQNGSVRFDGSLDPHGSYTMQTTSGDVDLALPANAAFSLSASTGSGGIQNAFGGSLIGAAPRAQVSLQTQNGSISLVKNS